MAKKQVAVSLRKPPSPEAMDAFVLGDAPAEPTPAPKRVRKAAPKSERAEAVEASPIPPSVTPAPESAVQSTQARDRESAPEAEPTIAPPIEPTPASPVVGPAGFPLRPVTIYLPPSLAERLALHCIQYDREASNVIGDALENHLAPRLGAAPSPSSSSSGREKPEEPASRRVSGFWTEPPFARIEWPPRRLEQIVEIGRILLGVVRRRGAAA
jgi:hypothetical protein